MNGLPHFDAAAIRSIVDMPACIEALRTGSLLLGDLHPRTQVSLGPTDDFLMMPAVSPAGIGVKIVNVVSGNRERGLPLIHGFYLYCDRETGVPTATLDGSALTTLRTPAASALAADLLARPEATTLGVFGTGVQARGHVEAMLAVRPGITRILVTGRSEDSAESFVTSLDVGGRPAIAAGPRETAGCDIVCGCTSSTTSVELARLRARRARSSSATRHQRTPSAHGLLSAPSAASPSNDVSVYTQQPRRQQPHTMSPSCSAA